MNLFHLGANAQDVKMLQNLNGYWDLKNPHLKNQIIILMSMNGILHR